MIKSAQSTSPLRAAVILVMVVGSLSYKIYQDAIPNGNAVPHPCKSNYIWTGVGHRSVTGGGVRNPFGAAFEAAGKTWTSALCNADSDNDGKSNGVELGDPDCTWTKGTTPKSTAPLSHPGICEPTESAQCLNENGWSIDCSEGADFTCEGIGDPDTVNLTLKFDRTQVPSAETTYMCQTFQLPSDKTYHLFATRPEIDNDYVMHHTLVYGCSEEVVGFESPNKCSMGGDQCTTLLAAWSVGITGECQSGDNGFLVGKGHFTTIIIEQHWNNPENEVNYFDESGMTLFLTPTLRTNNLGFLMTGQELLKIPAGEEAVAVSGTCPGECTKKRLDQSVYVTMAHLHMHYLGSAGSIEQWRDGKLLKKWFDESTYSYDSPIFNIFDPPIEVKPGDEIRTNCVFKSTSQKEDTYFGIATSSEMCYGFMNYYPVEAGTDKCVSWGSMDACEIDGAELNKPSLLVAGTLLLVNCLLLMR